MDFSCYITGYKARQQGLSFIMIIEWLLISASNNIESCICYEWTVCVSFMAIQSKIEPCTTHAWSSWPVVPDPNPTRGTERDYMILLLDILYSYQLLCVVKQYLTKLYQPHTNYDLLTNHSYWSDSVVKNDIVKKRVNFWFLAAPKRSHY